MKICLRCETRHADEAWRCPKCGHVPGRDGNILILDKAGTSCKDGFNDDLFPLLEKIETKHFWFNRRNQLILWALRTYFPSCRTMIEIGCGTGYVLQAVHRAFPNIELCGSEQASAGLKVASKRLPATSLMQMDARNIPFENEFDAIGCFDVIEHIGDDETVLREMHKAVKPGGGIIITVPQHPRLWSQFDVMSGHKRRYTRQELIAKVSNAGFTVIRTTSFITLLLPALMIVRLHSHLTRQASPLGMLKAMPETANALCNMITGLETCAIKAGVSFTNGSSLLLIAKKEL